MECQGLLQYKQNNDEYTGDDYPTTDIPRMVLLLRSYKRNRQMNFVRDFFVSIAHCRDIYSGKGQRDLSYRMIYALYQVFPILAIKSLHLMVGSGIGSWCDIKYFCLMMERTSPYGLYDPLVEVMIQIANRQLKKDLDKLDSDIDNGVGISNVAKWIPRESHHPELFGLFVRDWFRHRPSGESLYSGSKKSYRKIVVRLCSMISLEGYGTRFLKLMRGKSLLNIPGGCTMPSMEIGFYVRAVLEGAESSWIDYEWRKLMRTFGFCGNKGIAVVDLDLGIDKRDLYNALGFACLISEKMGIGRVLLGGSVPICVDISVCSGFCESVRLLWQHCEGRGASCMKSVMNILEKKNVPGLRVFVFSRQLKNVDMDSYGEKNIEYIFWGLSREIEGKHMSGYGSGAIKKFLSSGSQQEWMLRTYGEWYSYIDDCLLKLS